MHTSVHLPRRSRPLYRGRGDRHGQTHLAPAPDERLKPSYRDDTDARYQRRHPVAGLPLAVLYKYFDDSGGYLAALLTYYAFVSFCPLLLLLSTILGFVLAGHSDLQQRVLASAVSQFPIVATHVQDPKSIGGGPAGLIVGIIGLIYGSLGVAQAAQHAMNTAWRVPRHKRPNFYASECWLRRSS